MLDPTAGGVVSNSRLGEMVQRWTANINHHLEQRAGLIPPLYRFAPDSPQFGQAGEEPTIALPLEFLGQPQRWQNGMPTLTPGLRRYHGTRTNVAMSIMLAGLRSSPMAHGQTGVWMTGDIRLAVNWSVNPLDEFPTVVLQLWVDSTSLVFNSDVRAGNITRAVSVPPAGQILPNLQIEQLMLRIPTENHVNWQQTFRAALQAAINNLVEQNLRDSIFVEVWTLTSWRICYRGVPGSMNTDFGGPFDAAYPISINLSLILAQILWSLSVAAPRTRLRHLELVCVSTIPGPLQNFFATNYPGILNHCTAPPSATADQDNIWSCEYKFMLRRWAVMQYHYEPDFA